MINALKFILVFCTCELEIFLQTVKFYNTLGQNCDLSILRIFLEYREIVEEKTMKYLVIIPSEKESRTTVMTTLYYQICSFLMYSSYSKIF